MRCISAFLGSLAVVSAAAPNFIFLLVDDVGKGDFDTGGTPRWSPALTPEVAQMSASPGVAVFSRMYSGGAVCSPTRSTMLTGRTPTRECIINVEENPLPAVLNMTTTAAYARRAGYATFFGGKWHLGSLTNATTPDCYPAPQNGSCWQGYIYESGLKLCCDGRDAYVPVATPPQFGFDTSIATSQVAPSSTANCGCVETVPGAGTNCNLGHYAGAGHNSPPSSDPWLECDQYMTYNATANDNTLGAPINMASVQYVTPVDDAEFLVDNLLAFVDAAMAAGKPFLAQVSFHHNHIPYISPPSFRSMYANYTENEQDYYGGLSCVDAQIGRIRAALASRGISQNTWLSLTSDNGPELSIGDHGTTPFPNPGSAGGLTGRKRALTEGGINVPGIIEFPALISSNMQVGPTYPASTMDYLPTVMDLLSAVNPLPSWPLDGASLVPLLSGAEVNRSTPIGWLSDFQWQSENANGTVAKTCGDLPVHTPPSYNASFATPFDQPQLAWTEGCMKLFGCRPSTGSWRFALWDICTDPQERNDLWPSQGSTLGEAMFRRANVWMDSVRNSVAVETQCTIGHSAVVA